MTLRKMGLVSVGLWQLLGACAPVNVAVAPAPRASASLSPAAMPSEAPVQTLGLQVQLDLSDLPAAEQAALVSQELQLSLSETIDPESWLQPGLPPSSEDAEAPAAFSETRTFALGESVRFVGVPAGRDYTLYLMAGTGLYQAADPKVCEPTEGPVQVTGTLSLPALAGDQTVTLKARRSVAVDLVACERTAVSGQILDPAGAPVPDARVTLEAFQKPAYFDSVLDVQSDAEGFYRFEGVYAGLRLVLNVSAPGYVAQRRELSARSDKSGDPRINQFNWVLTPEADHKER